ncbi:hypothetical protein C8R44DRAFT_749647 [Mycena epipterygia]|nr:hypothetical protein C8R44DRAFT_749647 [Mycena epipterygia]
MHNRKRSRTVDYLSLPEFMICLTVKPPEAMHGARPFQKGLEIWLDEQRFPPKLVGTPKKSYYERLRAKLKVKEARRAALIKMCHDGLQRYLRHWPKRYDPAPYVAHGKENLAVEAPVDPAREARVAELMRLKKRAGTAHRRYPHAWMLSPYLPSNLSYRIAQSPDAQVKIASELLFSRPRSRNATTVWMDPKTQDSILTELRRRAAACVPTQKLCDGCGVGQGEHQCRDCFWAEYRCAACIVSGHAHHPLHRIKTWDGQSFIPGSLRALGLRLQLGHAPSPEDHFVIVDSRGIHHVAIDFCGCDPGRLRAAQLREARLLAMGRASAIAYDLGVATMNLNILPDSSFASDFIRPALLFSPSPEIVIPPLFLWMANSGSAARTRVRRKRRLTPIPPTATSRPNVAPTPFVPPSERWWRRTRARSLGAEYATATSMTGELEENWTTSFQELLDWAKDSRVPGAEALPTETLPTALPTASSVLTMPPSDFRGPGPGSRQDLLDDHSESYMASDQWRNALAFAYRAMREPDRRDMFLDEAIAERWDERCAARETRRETGLDGTWNNFSAQFGTNGGSTNATVDKHHPCILKLVPRLCHFHGHRVDLSDGPACTRRVAHHDVRWQQEMLVDEVPSQSIRGGGPSSSLLSSAAFACHEGKGIKHGRIYPGWTLKAEGNERRLKRKTGAERTDEWHGGSAKRMDGGIDERHGSSAGIFEAQNDTLPVQRSGDSMDGGIWYLTHWGLITRDSERVCDLQEVDQNPRTRLQTDVADYPMYAARTFERVLKFLPLCVGFSDAFKRDADTGKWGQVGAVYFVVEKSTHVTEAEHAYMAGGNYWAGIYATASRDEAETLAEDNLWED